MKWLAASPRFWIGSFFTLIVVIALWSPRTDVGGWNDGTRLATVESLVDRHTLSIDDSMFAAGTLDKIFVRGHFYSDKPPVPSVWHALVYAIAQSCFGLEAARQPGLFIYVIGVTSCGLAYLLSAIGIYRIGRRLQLPWPSALLLTASFALTTLSLVYVRQLNAHIMLLASAAWLTLGLIDDAELKAPWRVIGIGLLAGLSYAIDLGTGLVLAMGAAAFLAWRTRSLKTMSLFALGALPFFTLHHVLNYAIGHTFGPVAAVPEYFQYEGSAFDSSGLTGHWMHKHLGICLRYGLTLLVGPRGFLSHQPVLWLALIAYGPLCLRPMPERPLLILAGLWCFGTWLLYTVASNNDAGLCFSIRWFLPLLVPGFVVLGLALREFPSLHADLALLSFWGLLLVVPAWDAGPWAFVNVTWLIIIQVGALVTWMILRYRQLAFSIGARNTTL